MSLYIYDGVTQSKRLIFGVGIGTVEGSDYLLVSYTGTALTGTVPNFNFNTGSVPFSDGNGNLVQDSGLKYDLPTKILIIGGILPLGNSLLQVGQAGSATAINGNMPGLEILNTNTTTGTLSGIGFGSYDNGSVARTQGALGFGRESVWISGSANYPSYFTLWTKPAGGTQMFERFRIDSLGNIISATANATILLTDVTGTTHNILQLSSSGNLNIGGSSGASGLYGGNMFFYLGAPALSFFFRDSTAVDKVKIDSSGNTTIAGNFITTGSINIGNILTRYNGIATVGNGLAAEVATVDIITRTGTIGSTTLYAIPATNGGQYLVTWYAKVTQAATTNSQLGALTVGFTDNTDSVVQSQVCMAQDSAGSAVTATPNNSTTTRLSGILTIWAKESTNITYSWFYSSTGATPMQYELHIKLEYLG